jgi:Ca2+:H+ antiporter
MDRKEKMAVVLAAIATGLAGTLHHLGANVVLTFAVTAAALALLALIVGDATEQLGSKLGPGATGILQSALGNLPELFVCIFALRAGLTDVVKAALVGSILGNSLLVFGLALFLGGLKNGKQTFQSEPPKMIVTLLLLAVAALMIPTLAKELHAPAEAHIGTLSVACSLVLLVVLAASIWFSVKGDPSVAPAIANDGHAVWPLSLTISLLLAASVGAAFVSDWFVEGLQPAMRVLGVSDTFAGLVVVAIAGNAIENLVGIQLAWKNQADYAVSVILNSSLQVALGLIPALVLLSFVIGGSILTLVLPPLLIAALLLTALACAFVVYDGESIWLEGLALIGLYCIIAAAFWWG